MNYALKSHPPDLNYRLISPDTNKETFLTWFDQEFPGLQSKYGHMAAQYGGKEDTLAIMLLWHLCCERNRLIEELIKVKQRAILFEGMTDI